jgi:hypothetical protein
MSSEVGLSKDAIRQVIQKHLDQNADLLIGSDDPEMVQLIEVLCDGITEAISANNKQITDNLKRGGMGLGMRLE